MSCFSQAHLEDEWVLNDAYELILINSQGGEKIYNIYEMHLLIDEDINGITSDYVAFNESKVVVNVYNFKTSHPDCHFRYRLDEEEKEKESTREEMKGFIHFSLFH